MWRLELMGWASTVFMFGLMAWGAWQEARRESS